MIMTTFVPLNFTINNAKNMDVIPKNRNWNEIKVHFNAKFAFLTRNNKNFAKEKKEMMFGKLEISLGKSKEDLQKIITGF